MRFCNACTLSYFLAPRLPDRLCCAPCTSFAALYVRHSPRVIDSLTYEWQRTELWWHRYRVVTSSCVRNGGMAPGVGATSPGVVAPAIFPSPGTRGRATPFRDGGPAAASTCSLRVCATSCLLNRVLRRVLHTSLRTAVAPPNAALWHSCRLLRWPAHPLGGCPSSGHLPHSLELTPLGESSPTSAPLRPR